MTGWGMLKLKFRSKRIYSLISLTGSLAVLLLFQNCGKFETFQPEIAASTALSSEGNPDSNPVPLQPQLPNGPIASTTTTLPPNQPIEKQTWTVNPAPIFRKGSLDAMNLSVTLPSAVKRGGSFTLDAQSAAGLPSGMQLTADGVLKVGSAEVSKVSGLVFAYQEPGSPMPLRSMPVDVSVVEVSALKNGSWQTQPVLQPFSIVYIRIPRTTGGFIQAAGANPRVAINGQFDRFPETANWIGGMSGPGQLVYRQANGQEKILFDCIGQKHTPIVNGVPDAGGPRDCLPMDPSVSFDGKKVIFSVFYGEFQELDYSLPVRAEAGANLSRILAVPLGAQMFEAEFATGQVRALHYRKLGDYDTSPIYIPWDETDPTDKDRIMFTSDRAKELPSSMLHGPMPQRSFNHTVLQLHIADQDGKNARRVGVHDRDGVLHPYVLSDGRVVFTTWSLSQMGSFRKNNGSPRKGASPENEAWLASVNSKGGFFVAEYGRHGKHRDQTGGTINSVGLHFLTETSDRSWICTDDYYRGNNKGAGLTTCYEREPVGVEGPYLGVSPKAVFMPRFMKLALAFGSNTDVPSDVGGTRDPMGIPGNQLMVAWLRGNSCFRSDVAVYRDGSSCDGGIYHTTSIPAQPAQMQKIVDDPNYHEFMARMAEPYQLIYGIEKPAFAGHQAKSPNGKCYLGSSSMDSEVEPLLGYSFNGGGLSSFDCAVQGCKARQIDMSQVKAIRFWEVLPHDEKFIHAGSTYSKTGQPNFLKSLAGNRLRLLGDAPLKPDGSFIAEIPCDTTYVMAGVTQDGEAVLRDQVPQSLRPGEVRTCTGCHLHSGRPGRPFDQSVASQDLKKHFQMPSPGLVSSLGIAGGFQEMWKGQLKPQLKIDSAGQTVASGEAVIYEYNQHIVPILNASCVRCHSNGLNALNLVETGAKDNFFASIGADHEQSFYLPFSLWNTLTNKRPDIAGDWEVPRLSKYVHMGFALESLLYWKAAGARKDGRTDASVTNDLDYGVMSSTDPHAGVPEDHIRIIKNWIDAGSYLHQGTLPSNYRPPIEY
jgi:hypothetical protein